MLRELWSRKRLLLIGLVVSAIGAGLSVYQVVGLLPPKLRPRSLVYSVAYTQAVVDSSDSFLGDGHEQIGPLLGRAIVYANVMASPAFVDLIGRYAGVPSNEIWVAGPVDPSLQRAVIEPTPTKRGFQVAGESDPYRLEFLSDPNLPTVGVYAQAPSTGQAVALADASVRALTTYVDQIENQEHVAEINRVAVRQVGQATGGVTNAGIKKKLAGMVFVFVFVVWCVLILIGIRARASWRASALIDPDLRLRSQTAGSDAHG